MNYKEADRLVETLIEKVKTEQADNPYVFSYITGMLKVYLSTALSEGSEDAEQKIKYYLNNPNKNGN